MARVRQRLDRAQIAALGRSDGVVEVVRDVAERGVAFAKTIAPDAPPIGFGYVERLRATAEVERGRAVGRIVTTSFLWHWIEFGTGGDSPTPAFRVLGRTVDFLVATGDR